MEEATPTSNPTHFGEGLELQQKLMQWWSEIRKSETPPPLSDVLIHYGLKKNRANGIINKVLDDICEGVDIPDDRWQDESSEVDDDEGRIDDHLHDWERTAFSKTLVPGLLTYFSEHIYPREVSDYGPTLYPKLFRKQTWPAEQDILAFTNARSPDYDIVLPMILRRDTSAEFLEAMCTKAIARSRGGPMWLYFPDNAIPPNGVVGNPAYRTAYNHNCVLGVRSMLPKLLSMEVTGKWERNALAELLVYVLHTTSSMRLEVNGVTLVDEDDKTKSTDCHLSTASSNSTQFCGKLAYRPEGRGGVDELVFQFMRLSPELEAFQYRGNLKVAVPEVIQLMQHSKSVLQRLFLYGSQESFANGQPLLQLLEALKHNGTLDYLFTQLPDDDLPAYKEKLEEVLQEGNTKLTRLDLDGKWWGETNHHYLQLNRFGRKVARDPGTKVSELVDLLIDAGNFASRPRRQVGWGRSDEERGESQYEPFNITYGLLREMPGMWSAQGEVQQQKHSKMNGKRKFDDM